MKKIMKTCSAVLLTGLICVTANAKNSIEKEKKTQSISVSRKIDVPIEKVWAHVADDFGGIAKAHPGFTGSHKIEGSPTTGEGCERVCYLDDAHKKYTKEVQTNYNKENRSFDAKIFELAGLPMDETVSVGHYKLNKIDENTTEIVFTMNFRTKPAFLGALMKGSFKSQLADYLFAVDHYLNTGEEVNKENFKTIKKKYKEKEKKTQSFSVSRKINAPIEKVWAHVAEDFSGIAKAHPGLYASSKIEGSPQSGEGCKRVSYLDAAHKKYTKEVQTNYNKENRSFDAKIFESVGLPLDETVSRGHYKLNKIDENTTEITFTMNLRTKPAFLGALLKGKFKSQLADYLLAVDHYLKTGEEVNKENFEKIKKELL